MSYADEMISYANKGTYLMGHTPNDADYSSGNPLLETGTAYVFLKHLDTIVEGDRTRFMNALYSCNVPGKFLASKPGTIFRISHDDVIGVVAGLSAIGTYYTLRGIILGYGEKHRWVLSTDGVVYWDAWTKPWHKAFYYLAAGRRPGTLNLVSLALMLTVDALFNRSNSSNKRLAWLMIQTIKGKSFLIDQIIKLWYAKLRSNWGSAKNIFLLYHGPKHIFTRYCWE